MRGTIRETDVTEEEVATKIEAEAQACPHCGKPEPLCLCDSVEAIDNRVEVLILQHPQEQDRLLGTARLAATVLSKAVFRIGLSCVFAKQSRPPGLCPTSKVALRWGLLLPKVRRQFAEFLQYTSLKRLGILYLPTCVGFGYGL